MHGNALKRHIPAYAGTKWHKVAQGGTKRAVQGGTKWHKVAQGGPSRPKVARPGGGRRPLDARPAASRLPDAAPARLFLKGNGLRAASAKPALIRPRRAPHHGAVHRAGRPRDHRAMWQSEGPACVRATERVRAADGERKSGDSWRGALPRAVRSVAGGRRRTRSAAATVAAIRKLGCPFCRISPCLGLSRLISACLGFFGKKSWRTSEIRRRHFRMFIICSIWGGHGCGGHGGIAHARGQTLRHASAKLGAVRIRI